MEQHCKYTTNVNKMTHLKRLFPISRWRLNVNDEAYFDLNKSSLKVKVDQKKRLVQVSVGSNSFEMTAIVQRIRQNILSQLTTLNGRRDEKRARNSGISTRIYDHGRNAWEYWPAVASATNSTVWYKTRRTFLNEHQLNNLQQNKNNNQINRNVGWTAAEISQEKCSLFGLGSDSSWRGPFHPPTDCGCDRHRQQDRLRLVGFLVRSRFGRGWWFVHLPCEVCLISFTRFNVFTYNILFESIAQFKLSSGRCCQCWPAAPLWVSTSTTWPRQMGRATASTASESTTRPVSFYGKKINLKHVNQ